MHIGRAYLLCTWKIDHKLSPLRHMLVKLLDIRKILDIGKKMKSFMKQKKSGWL